MKSNLSDFILIIPKLAKDELCDIIINEFNDEEYSEGTLENYVVKKNIRNCEAISLTTNESINKNKIVRMEIDNQLFSIFSEAILQYEKKHPNFSIQNDTGYELLRYFTGNFYKEHTDSFKDRPRTLTCSLMLNDNYIGGDFSFFNDTINYKLNKGDAILFPSNFMFPHAVKPIVKGVRYSVVTWFL